MNLATAAPEVEEAVAEKAAYQEPATADPAQQSEAVHVGAAPEVDPALPYDDPMRYAPAIVANPQAIQPDALSVVVLRGSSGADFESEAAICRGAPEKNFLRRCLPCVFDERDFASYGELKKYCLVKGDCCFVYAEATSPKPLYAIPLEDFDAWIEDRDNPDKLSITINPEPVTNKQPRECVTILLKSRSNEKQEPFQFTFKVSNDPTLPQRFMDVLRKASTSSDAKEKRVGVTASVAQAKLCGKVAVKTQPMI